MDETTSRLDLIHADLRRLDAKVERFMAAHVQLHATLAENNADVRQKLWVELTRLQSQLNWRSGFGILAILAAAAKGFSELKSP